MTVLEGATNFGVAEETVRRWIREPDGTVIVHADRGLQFRACGVNAAVKAAGPQGFIGRVASAGDNAVVESFWVYSNATSPIPGSGAREQSCIA